MQEHTNQPKVKVWVEDGVIKVDQHLLQIPIGSRDVPIKWVMKEGSEWTFTSDGIIILDHDGQFINFHRTDHGKKFHCVDKNTEMGDFKYNVKVSHGTTVLELDPIIQNGGSEGGG